MAKPSYRNLLAGVAVSVAAFGATGAQAQATPAAGDKAVTLSSLATHAQARADKAGNAALWTCASAVLKEDGRFGKGAHIASVNPRGEGGTVEGGGAYVRVTFDPAQTKDFGGITASNTGFYGGVNDHGLATAEASTERMRYERTLPATTNASGLDGDTGAVRAAVAGVAARVKSKCLNPGS